MGGGALVLAAIVGLFVYYHNRETTDDAQVDGHITPMASKVYGRVAQVLVDDNQAVKAGQVLVKIDARDYQAALDQAKASQSLAESEARSAGVDVPRTRENVASGNSSAEAQFMGAQADVARAQSTYEQAQTADLALAQANVEKSRANAELAKADLARYLPLMEKGEISKQQYDAAKANADATASGLQADLQKQAQARRNVEVAKAQLDAAKARVEQARAGVALAHADVKQVSMRAAECAGKARQSGASAGRGGSSGAELELHGDHRAGGWRGHAQTSGAGTDRAGGPRIIGSCAAAERVGDGKFQRDATEEYEARPKGGSEGGYLRKNIQRTRGFDCGSDGSGAESPAAGKRHGKLREGGATDSGEDRADPIPQEKAVLRPGMNVDATVITN